MGNHVHIVGAPMDFGADRRGVDMGPSAIRYAGLAEAIETAGLDCVDTGDLFVPRAEQREADTARPETGNAKFLPEIEDVCIAISSQVSDSIDSGAIPLVLGGDHSLAIGSIGGSARDTELGVIWFDAHGDFNTPKTTPSGNVHGMALAAVLGRGVFDTMDWARSPTVQEDSIAYVGLRDLDPGERKALRESDVTAFTMSDIDRDGITTVVESAIDIATTGTESVHISLDMDTLDPNIAPGVGTPVRGGLTYREAHSALETIAGVNSKKGFLRSMDIVEVNPILDQHNETAELAVELAASLFGERIM